MQYKKLTICLALAFAPSAFSAEPETMPQVEVNAAKLESLPAPATTGLDAGALEQKRVYTSDTAKLLDGQPGVSLYGAGGVSSLPVIHGMADDRIRTKVDGMDLIASCPNHMNSPLSYIDPSNVGELKVFAGITPVSVGGDSIGGTIIANTKNPEFAAEGQGTLTKGEIGARYGSNGNQQGLNANVTVASESLSMTYSGAMTKSDNYDAGGNYRNFSVTSAANPANVAAGVPYLRPLGATEVGSTAYDARNHTLGLAMKGSGHLLEAKLGYQDIPYELYPNQRMDMLGNTQNRINLRYQGDQNWGKIEARAYHETVDHFMDFGQDKLYTYGKLLNLYPVNGMPMYTTGKTDGLSAKADIDLNSRDLLRLGAEWQDYRLNDWWPPAPDCGYTGAVANCTGGMAPNTFWNIRDGKRDRMAVYSEWEAAWSPVWETLAGLRYEQVKTDSAAVQGYNATMMYAGSSVGTLAQWNALNRARTDDNIDLSTLARYTPTETNTFEFGFAQKTRSPNLYERYSWSTNSMAMEMNNFVGDGNGYVGNPNLKPEVARTVSATANWHTADQDAEFKVTPYYTYVMNYIDAVYATGQAVVTNQFVKLTYANQSARIYGADISGRMPLGNTSMGDWGVRGLLNYTNGKNLTTGDNLYNIMPLNAKVTLTQKIAGWDNALEVIGVERKSSVSAVRNEVKTPGYGLVNLRTSYTWSNLRFDFGVENITDKMYYLPLGGAYTGEGATMSFNKEAGIVRPATANIAGSYGTSGSASMWGTAVPGMGRSIYVGATLKF
jgi:iron complex outermembrane receptor protein